MGHKMYNNKEIPTKGLPDACQNYKLHSTLEELVELKLLEENLHIHAEPSLMFVRSSMPESGMEHIGTL
jgi:hypothetical protein